jgi:hypothetical protein
MKHVQKHDAQQLEQWNAFAQSALGTLRKCAAVMVQTSFQRAPS